jgi:hypothetical protein
VAARLLGTTSQYLRRSAELIQDARFLDVPARIARMLLELAAQPASTELPPLGTLTLLRPSGLKQRIY